MLPLVHTPIRTAAELARMVAERRSESPQLEFKGLFWKEKNAGTGDHIREAAKDVAALANGLGGDLILGVQATNSQAMGFSPWCAPGQEDKRREDLRDWLLNYLRPQSFAAHVELVLLPTPSGACCPQALVVTVPPSRDLVGAVVDSAEQSVRYPARAVDGTQWISPEEAMKRYTLGTRARFLAMRQVLDPPAAEHHFRLVSPFLATVADHSAHVELLAQNFAHREPIAAVNGSHGLVGALEDSSFLVRPRPVEIRGTAWSLVIPPGLEFIVPLDLVQTVWCARNKIVQLALSAALIWDGSDFVFETH